MTPKVGSIVKYEIFLSVVELGSFKAAADRMGYTSAGVSYAINSLEDELGLTLFKRNHSGVSLTSEVEAVYPYIKDICNDERLLENVTSDLIHLEQGRLSVSVFTSLYVNWFPLILRDFKDQHPNVYVDVTCCDDSFLINDLLREGHIDCAFCTLPVADDIDTIPVATDPIYIVLPQGHPLADCDAVPLAALTEYPYIGPGTVFEEVDAIFEKYAITPQLSLQSVDDHACLCMVVAGFGYALFPKMFLENTSFPVVIKDLAPPQHREIVLAVHSCDNLTATTRRFIRVVKDWCQRNPGTIPPCQAALDKS